VTPRGGASLRSVTIADSRPFIFQRLSHTSLRIRPFQRSLRRPRLGVPLRVVQAWWRARRETICNVSHEEPALTLQEISDLPLTSYLFTGSPALGYTLSKRTKQWSVKTICLRQRGRPTQISTPAFSTFRDPFPLITAMKGQVDSRLGVVGFLAQWPEQWTEAARPEELVVLAIDAQRIWCYAFCAVHGPMQTIKPSGGS
jgi:hypothetical protein